MTRRIGRQFGNSTITAVAESRKTLSGKYKYRFSLRCTCGHEYILSGESLGNAKEPCPQCRASAPTQPRTSTYHHPLYETWGAMHQRCANPNDSMYHRYGGRGIYVCKEWTGDTLLPGAHKSKTGFDQFLLDMGPKPSPEHSLDRIDNDGPYSPSNCRWATRAEQYSNRSQNVWVECRGHRLTMQQWFTTLRVDKSTAYRAMREMEITHLQLVEYLIARFERIHGTFPSDKHPPTAGA